MLETARTHGSLPASHLGIDGLQEVYASLQFEPEVTLDGDLLVVGERAAVIHDLASAGLLRFRAPFVAAYEASIDTLCLAINDFNRHSILTKAHVCPDTDLGHWVVFESHLEVDHDLDARKLLAHFRKFQEAIHSAAELAPLLA